MCYAYGNSVENASKDKKKTIDQLLGIQKVLDDVRELVEDQEASRLPALYELLTKPDGLKRCEDELKDLEAKLKPKPSRTDHKMQALIWPLKEGEVKKTLDYLRQLQQLWSSSLNVDQTYISPNLSFNRS